MRTANGQLEELLAIREGQDDEIRILPPYERRVTISSNSVEVQVWQVTSDVDRMQAMHIILRSHYLNAPARGLILGCRFVDLSDQEQVRDAARSGNYHDAWSPAWQEEPGGMVACAVLDTMFHGNPNGRRDIANYLLRTLDSDSDRHRHITELLEGEWQSKERTEVLDSLRVAYASRFAVDAPYRHMGLGTLLAQCLLNVGAHYRSPQAEFVEVITTLPSKRVESLVKQKEDEHDFLRRAGYRLIKDVRPSRPLLQANPTTGDKIVPVSAKKLYYYGMTNRLIQS